MAMVAVHKFPLLPLIMLVWSCRVRTNVSGKRNKRGSVGRRQGRLLGRAYVIALSTTFIALSVLPNWIPFH
jgi:hypothetical protein